MYLRQNIFHELAPNIVYPRDLVFGPQPELFRKHFSEKNSMIWIGTKGNITPLHYDRCHGFLCQLKGSKKLTLFKPKDTNNIYQVSPETGCSHTSRLCVEALFDPPRREQELRKFPKASRVKPRYCFLQEGDCIYIPPGWWHHVEHITNSISVTLAWDIDLGIDKVIPPNMFA
eukprot:TRINITY_DN8041_c0_g1_i1.p1 TRINITY_DN8041_c0_g1~~TRINITY_DN8041_c0_g1_i1.p1  ORF type:complete len:173 (+),score=31.23 TRINITY_DN8041_c0_g1_i1:562-1080(+)